MTDDQEFFSKVGTAHSSQSKLKCIRCGGAPYSQINRVVLCKKCEKLYFDVSRKYGLDAEQLCKVIKLTSGKEAQNQGWFEIVAMRHRLGI